jgi:hypothetical protein
MGNSMLEVQAPYYRAIVRTLLIRESWSRRSQDRRDTQGDRSYVLKRLKAWYFRLDGQALVK